MKRTVKDHELRLIRFQDFSEGIISKETIHEFLSEIKEKYHPLTYNGYLRTLRKFLRFMGCYDLIKDYKYAPIPSKFEFNDNFPTLEDLRKGFEVLKDDRERAIYLFFITTGLRTGEVLKLKITNILWKYRAVIPNHDTRTKKSGITFFTEECEYYLRKYLESRKDNKDKLFRIMSSEFKNMWKRVSNRVGKYIRPQVIRKWFALEMRIRGVPDSFVDIFQGRAPKTVLEQHYTPIGVERLKEVYDKAFGEIRLSLANPYCVDGQK